MLVVKCNDFTEKKLACRTFNTVTCIIKLLSILWGNNVYFSGDIEWGIKDCHHPDIKNSCQEFRIQVTWFIVI